jgi:hypothetical protein
MAQIKYSQLNSLYGAAPSWKEIYKNKLMHNYVMMRRALKFVFPHFFVI